MSISFNLTRLSSERFRKVLTAYLGLSEYMALRDSGPKLPLNFFKFFFFIRIIVKLNPALVGPSQLPISHPRPVSLTVYRFSAQNNEDPIKKRGKYSPCNESQVWGVKIKLNDLSPQHLLMSFNSSRCCHGDIWRCVNQSTITVGGWAGSMLRGTLGGPRCPFPLFVPLSASCLLAINASLI